jgi:hypothetical protein
MNSWPSGAWSALYTARPRSNWRPAAFSAQGAWSLRPETAGAGSQSWITDCCGLFVTPHSHAKAEKAGFLSHSGRKPSTGNAGAAVLAPSDGSIFRFAAFLRSKTTRTGPKRFSGSSLFVPRTLVAIDGGSSSAAPRTTVNATLDSQVRSWRIILPCDPCCFPWRRLCALRAPYFRKLHLTSPR